MIRNNQIKKNIELSQRLLSFIVAHNDKLPRFVSQKQNNTYVIFSWRDEELNVINEKLLSSLQEEGKSIIRVEETKNKQNPWSFAQL